MVKPFLSEKNLFFNFFQQYKWIFWLKSCKVFIYVLFFMSSTKKLPTLVVLTWFLNLGKIQGPVARSMVSVNQRLIPLQRIGFDTAQPMVKANHALSNSAQDGNHCWWRHRPPVAPNLILLRRSKAFHWRLISFRNTATYQNLWGRVPSTTSPPLVPRWGYEFACRSEG